MVKPAILLLVGAALSTALAAQQNPRPPAPAPQPAAGVRFGRVLTASAVQGWGQYSARDRFLPGERVWVYAETVGTTRKGQVNLVFHFRVTGPGGVVLYDGNAEFDEPATSLN